MPRHDLGRIQVTFWRITFKGQEDSLAFSKPVDPEPDYLGLVIATYGFVDHGDDGLTSPSNKTGPPNANAHQC